MWNPNIREYNEDPDAKTMLLQIVVSDASTILAVVDSGKEWRG